MKNPTQGTGGEGEDKFEGLFREEEEPEPQAPRDDPDKLPDPERMTRQEQEEIAEILRRKEFEEKIRRDIEARRQEEEVEIKFDKKPREVKELLDKDVIGQERAKRYLANAVCYHYARIRRDLEEQNERENGDEKRDEDRERRERRERAERAGQEGIGEEGREETKRRSNGIKKNVLLIGNSGVGKTYIISKLSKIVGVPFVKEDATKFSETGYVGKNVDDMIVSLYFAADRKIKLAECGIVFIDEIDKIRSATGYVRDVSGVGVQRGLLKLMEETDVDLLSTMDPLAQMHAMRHEVVQLKGKRPVINTRNILFIMAGAFPGLEQIVRKRLGLGQKEKADIKTAHEVAKKYPMPGLLKLIEKDDDGEEQDWRELVGTEDLIQYGFEPEFVGRLPIRVGFHDLNEEHLYQILKRSGDSITKEYVKDFFAYGIVAGFTDDALRVFAARAAKEKMGARALTKVVEDTLFEFLYELPSTEVREVNIDQKVVENPRQALVDLVLDSDLEGYKNKVRKSHDIRIKFDNGSYASIRKKAIETGVMPRDICEVSLGGYISVLAANGNRTFTVTEAIVDEPEKALNDLLRQYGKKE